MQNDALTKNIYEFSVENTHTSASVHKALKLFCLQAMCLETSQIRSKHEAHVVEESFNRQTNQIKILKHIKVALKLDGFSPQNLFSFSRKEKICQSFSAFYKASQITTMMK